MTDFNLPSIFVPLVGLVFPAIAMVSLFLHVQKNKIVQIQGIESYQLISTLYDNTDIYFVQYDMWLFPNTQIKELLCGYTISA